jgi:hypothetical protein
MKKDVEEFIQNCLVCQQDKIDTKMLAGVLQPLWMPERPWESVSMDFITQLLMTQGYNGIFVIVDKFSKYATFVPTKVPCSTEEVARMFFKHVVKLWGLSLKIMLEKVLAHRSFRRGRTE